MPLLHTSQFVSPGKNCLPAELPVTKTWSHKVFSRNLTFLTTGYGRFSHLQMPSGNSPRGSPSYPASDQGRADSPRVG